MMFQLFPMSLSGIILVILLLVYFLSAAIKILREYERGVVFRLGRVIPVKGPGLVIIWPIIDKLVRVSLRIIALEVPSQDVITRDNVSVKVSAVVYSGSLTYKGNNSGGRLLLCNITDIPDDASERPRTESAR